MLQACRVSCVTCMSVKCYMYMHVVRVTCVSCVQHACQSSVLHGCHVAHVCNLCDVCVMCDMHVSIVFLISSIPVKAFCDPHAC